MFTAYLLAVTSEVEHNNIEQYLIKLDALISL